MFNEKDKLLIRFENKLKNKDINFESKLTNDWRIDFIGYSEVSICSATLNVRLSISSEQFIKLIKEGIVRNGIFEENYRPLKYLGVFYLLKEGSLDYNIALENSKNKKLILKTGAIYDLYMKTKRINNLKTRSVLNMEGNSTIKKCVFLGSAILGTGGIFNKTLKVRTNTDTVYLFKIDKEIYWIKKRDYFDIVNQHGIDPNFKDKIDTLKNINEILLNRFKNNFEKNNLSNFEVLFSSDKDFKNSVKNCNDIYLEKSKLIVSNHLTKNV